MRRQDEQLPQPLFPFLPGVDTEPYGTQSEAMGCQQQVLRGSGTVNGPVTRRMAQMLITADKNGMTGFFQHGRMGMHLHDTPENRPVVDHKEMPGLFVHGRGSIHGRPDDLLYLLILHLLLAVLTDAAPRINRFQDIHILLLNLTKIRNFNTFIPLFNHPEL